MPSHPSRPVGDGATPTPRDPLDPAQREGRGDMDPESFRRAAHTTADLMADYLEGIERYPVLPPLTPGELRPSFAPMPPEEPEPLARILADYHGLVEPNVTHWQHPGFFAYFPSSASGPSFAPMPPEEPEPLARILADYHGLVEPNVTHWQHPGFFAYFPSSASGPGILGEMLMATLVANAMLWRTSPVATELEEVTVDWFRQAFGLP